jgi:hypothetical protein
MATIKLQNGKVITKDGKASCECCDFGCFFYPAVGIREGLYTAEDLPDFINLIFNEIYLYQKSGDTYFSVTSVGMFPAGNLRIRIFDRGGQIWTPGTEDFDLGWAWEGLFGSEWERIDSELLDGLFEETLPWATDDLFADTYTITGLFNNQLGSRIVTRIPPLYPEANRTCVWKGDGVTLRYNGSFTYDREPQWTLQGNFKWQVNGNNKTGFQNTPVGSYEGGYSVS